MRLSRKPLIAFLALILAMACAHQTMQAQEMQEAESAIRPVTVVLSCPEDMKNENRAVSATVAPWIRTADASAGDAIEWRLIVSGNGSTTFEVGQVSEDWGLTDPRYRGDGTITVQVPDDPDIDDGDTRTYRYDISMTCNGTEVVIDPEMEIEY